METYLSIIYNEFEVSFILATFEGKLYNINRLGILLQLFNAIYKMYFVQKLLWYMYHPMGCMVIS